MLLKNLLVIKFEKWNMHAIILPPESLEKHGLKIKDRIVASFDNGNQLQCAIVSLEKNQKGIMLGKHFLEKSELSPGQEVSLEIKKDVSEYGMPMPIELSEVLSTDDEGSLGFDALTPGKKRSIMYFIEKAKQLDTRITRALLVVENIKMGYTHPRDLTRKHG